MSAVEVDQGDHGGDLQLGFGLGYEVPHDLVLMPELGRGAREAFEEVGQIELVAGAGRSEDGVAQCQKERMDHDFGGEGGRLGREAGDVAGLGVEDLHARVEVTHVGVGSIDEGLNFGIDRVDNVAGEQVVDDDCAVPHERVNDLGGWCISRNVVQSTVARCVTCDLLTAPRLAQVQDHRTSL